MSSIAVYGVMLAGWSSGSKYPLLGSVRASAQMVSYEAALGLSVVAVVLVAGTLSTHDIVGRAGRRHRATGTSCATGVVPFVIFLIAGTAELNRPPFDLVEAEQELVGGFHTEYCVDPLRALLPGRVHEHDHDVGRSSSRSSSAARTVPRSFGPDWSGARSGSSSSCIVLPVRASSGSGPRCPGFRYDQLMDLGWKVLIPLVLGWLLLLAAHPGRPTIEDWNAVARASAIALRGARGRLRPARAGHRAAVAGSDAAQLEEVAS